ncbi:MAG: ribosome-binding factor A [Parcubacteria group bacterium ADurb.Bin326]|nr:MAG: ribosome-binding factor A [Parcubacteria group bacterium ADurb.Bin326]
MSERMVKVNELILQQLGGVINEEVEFPAGALATIVSVSTSPDLHYAQVKLSVFPEDQADYVVHKMNLLAKRLQAALAEKIVLRNLPKLKFVLDKSEDQAEDIERVLDRIKAELGE